MNTSLNSITRMKFHLQIKLNSPRRGENEKGSNSPPQLNTRRRRIREINGELTFQIANTIIFPAISIPNFQYSKSKVLREYPPSSLSDNIYNKTNICRRRLPLAQHHQHQLSIERFNSILLFLYVNE